MSWVDLNCYEALAATIETTKRKKLTEVCRKRYIEAEIIDDVRGTLRVTCPLRYIQREEKSVVLVQCKESRSFEPLQRDLLDYSMR